MDDCELVALVTAVACGVAKCCSEDEISLLSAAMTQLGDTLATILTQRQIKEKKESNSNQEDSSPVLPFIPPV